MGGSLTNAATSNYTGGSYGAISYASSATGVATVSSSGVITPVSVGTAVITATQAAVPGVNAQATQTYTLKVNAAASSDANLAGLTLSSGAFTPAFASGIITYTQSVTNNVSSITVTPTVNQANATVTVNGTAVATGVASSSIGLNVGANTITTVVTAQDGTKKTYALTVTRSAPLIEQNKLVLLASPNVITTVNQFSTLSTSGANGTGAVSYVVTKGSCKISVNIVTAGTADEICEITANKAADDVFLATSASVSIQVRISEVKKFADDKSVKTIQTAQLLQAQKFSSTQVQNIGNHLDSLRHSFNLAPSNFGIGINIPALTQIAPVINKIKEELTYKKGASRELGFQKNQYRLPSYAVKPLEELTNDFENVEELEDLDAVNSNINQSVSQPQTYSFWTAGTIDIGLFKNGDNPQTASKFKASGLTMGLDYKIGPTAIVGAAIGYEASYSKAGINESNIKSNQKSVTGYGLFGFGDGWVLDGMLGVGDLSFKGNRVTSDELYIFDINRQGKSFFGSTSIRKVFRVARFKLSPFIKHDSFRNNFAPYDETLVVGSPTNYALRYDNAKHLTNTASSGVLITHDSYLESGKLTSTAKFSRNQVKSGSFSQDIYFADLGEAGGIYTLKQAASSQNSTSLDLGLAYTRKGGGIFDFGWRVAVGGNQYKLNGLRFGIRIPI
jgi:hypothetical protein